METANNAALVVAKQIREISKLKARLGIVISALRKLEKRTGISLDDEDIDAIEADLNNKIFAEVQWEKEE